MEANPDIIKRIQAYQEQFKKYNETKLGNLQRALSEQQSINVLDLIPLLLNTNTPDLPGNIPGVKLPYGVYDYVASQRMVDFVTARFPGAVVPRKRVDEPFIQMIALIGSCGTIAYTKQSDFDFWICYNEGHTTAKRSASSRPSSGP